MNSPVPSKQTDASHGFDAEVLLQRYFDKSLKTEEAKQLLAYWDACEEFGDVVIKNLDVDAMLKLFAGLEKKPIGDGVTYDFPFRSKAAPLPLDYDILIRLAVDSPALPRSESPKVETYAEKTVAGNTPDSTRWTIILLALFVVVFGVLSYHEFNPTVDRTASSNENRVPCIAEVLSVADPVFASETGKLKVGSRLDAGKIELQRGLVELRLSSGVQLILRGPAELHLDTGMNVFCRRGCLSAKVPPEGRGFLVRTSWANIRDLGTEFAVEVSDSEAEVHVISGTVELDPLSGQWKTLVEGTGMISRPAGILEQVAVDRSKYVTPEEMAQATFDFEKRRLAEWNASQEKWNADPDLFLQLNFDGKKREKGVVRMLGIQNVSGRWKGKNATAFRSGRSVIHLESPRRSDTFTLFAAVRLNALSQASNVIFSVGDTKAGSILWQINGLGELQVMLGESGAEDLVNYRTPRVLYFENLRTWILVAVVVGEDKVSHYLDGSLVFEQPRRLFENDRFDFDFSHARLGNRPREDDAPTERFFNGSIDEFKLFGRALTQEEIAALTSSDTF